VQDTSFVGWNLHIADQSGVAPDAERVVWEAAGTDDLAVVVAPFQAGDLRTSVDAVGAGPGGSVPEVDVAVVRASTSSEEVQLPGTPAEGLDRSAVVGLGEFGSTERSRVPDVDQVVVTAGSELGSVRSPFKSADFGGVGDKLSNLVLSDTDVVVKDETAARTSRQRVLVPAHDTNAGVMAVHASKLGTFFNIPDLDFTGAESDANIGAITAPFNAADIGVRRGLQKTVDSPCVRRPNVDVTLETDGNLVARAPVQKVQIIVIKQPRSIQDTLWCGLDSPPELSRLGIGGLERAVVLSAEVNGLGRLRCRGLESENASVQVHAAGVSQRRLVSNSIGSRSSVGGAGGLVVVQTKVLESGRDLLFRSPAADVKGTGSVREHRRTIVATGLRP